MTREAADKPLKGQLEREAARLCAIMHGPDAEAHREEFQAWLRRGALHREAFNRAEETFLLGSKLPVQMLADAMASPRSTWWLKPIALGLPLAAIALFAVPLARTLSRDRVGDASLRADRPIQLRLSTMRISSETFRLADGSIVTLGPNSQLLVNYDRARRRLRLDRGRSRFDVAHQRRPFVVEAQRGAVTSVGTSFEVAILPDRGFSVRVREGSVDVTPDSGEGSSALQRRLAAGEEMTFGQRSVDEAADFPREAAATRGQAATVAELVAQANESAGDGPLLSVVDPSILSIRLGGDFRAHGPATVAERLSLMLDLSVDRTHDKITLRRRRHVR